MKIEFCLYETGDTVFAKDSEELKNLINVISRIGTEINISISKNEFIHGRVCNVKYNVDAENNEECLKIYIDKNYLSNKQFEQLETAKLAATPIADK